jgi:hypothetical protein
LLSRSKSAVAITLGALVLAGVLVSLFVSGLRDEVVVLGLVLPALVGTQVGWLTRASVPTWIFVVLAIGGVALVLLGLTQYDEHGDSGPLFIPLVGLGAAALPTASLVGGIAAGATLRRARD